MVSPGQRKKFIRLRGPAILGLVVGVAFSVLSLVYLFRIAERYLSYAVIMPLDSRGSFSFEVPKTDAMTAEIVSEFLGVGTVPDKAGEYSAILKSRKTFRRVIRSERIQEFYKNKYQTSIDSSLEESLVSKFIRRTEIYPFGAVIRIDVQDEDPELARHILDELLVVLAHTVNQTENDYQNEMVEFLSKRLHEEEGKLRQMTEAIAAKRGKKNLYAVPVQMRSTMAIASELQTRLVEKELEIERQKGLTRDPEFLKRLLEERNQIQRQLSRVIDGSTSKNDKFLVSLKDSPQMNMTVQIDDRMILAQSSFVDVLKQNLEITKIEANRNSPVIQVIDSPQVSDAPNYPNFWLSIALSFVLGLLTFTLVLLALKDWSVRS